MTRAERIEAAAAKLLARLATMTGDPFNPEEDDLRDAMALPREESAEGYVLRYPGDTLRDACSDGISELPLVTPRTARQIRVRIVAAPEGDAP